MRRKSTNITTAIITTAGFGTRLLPITSAVQKELLPILDRPAIDYIVADCIAAGANHVIFVVSPGSHGLQDYYIGNSKLEAHLERFGKHNALARLHAIHDSAKFTFIEQPEDAGYGTAVPLLVADPHLPKTEPFIVCYGDAFTWHTDGRSDLQALVEAFEHANGAVGALAGFELPKSELSRYGVLAVEKRGEIEYLTGLVEKPEPGQEPSNLANHGVYIFTPQLMNYVRQIRPDPRLGEYLLTDAVLAAARDQPTVVSRFSGRRFDTGNLAGWLETNLALAAARPDLATQLHLGNNLS